MFTSTVNGSGTDARSGAQPLLLLAAPLNCLILSGLADRPKRMAELRQEVGFPPQTTLRAQLKKLVEIGAIQGIRQNQFPGVLDYELTPSGEHLLLVASALSYWLEDAPGEPLRLGSNAAKAAIKALAEGWSTTMLRALASGPLSLTGLDRLIGPVSYPSLERRLGAMRLTGQVEPQPADNRSTPYAVTPWARRAIAPLVAAATWEQQHYREASPVVTGLDVEAAFLLTVPLLDAQIKPKGTCRMAVEFSQGGERAMAGVIVEARGGAIASCVTELEGDPDASVLGSPTAWFSAVLEADFDDLELSGNRKLARALVNGLHGALFGSFKAETFEIFK